MEEQEIIKQKSFLEKMAPFVLVALLIFLGYFAFTKIKRSSAVTQTVSPATSNAQIVVDIDFLNSDAFKNLKFIPDSSVFDEVKGTVPSGREDPFAPI